MFVGIIFTVRDYMMMAMGVIIIFCIYEILRLKSLIKKKNKDLEKSLLPLLKLEIDPYESAMYLKNDSGCCAKDIQIENLKVVLDYDFKKEIKLRFHRIDQLDPGEKIKLDFRAFDKEYEITSEQCRKIITRLENGLYEMTVGYSNIYDHKYEAVIVIDNKKVIFKKLTPLNKGIL